MSNGLIIVGFFAAIALTAVAYYMVLPAYYGVKEYFIALPVVQAHAEAEAFGELLYNICGIFPLLFLGAIFLYAYQNSVRQRSSDLFG